MSDEEDIILADLSDEDLIPQIHDDLYDGLTEEIEAATHILLDRGWSAEQVLSKALVDGMTIVGIDFRDGILFVPHPTCPMKKTLSSPTSLMRISFLRYTMTSMTG